MEFYLICPLVGPYVLKDATVLAEALASGHTLLPHEDAYMGALHGWQEREREQEAAVYFDNALEEAVELLEEPDYSSPEYLGEPEFEEDLAPAVEVPFEVKVWSRDQIKELLKRNDEAVDRAMVALSARDDLPPWQVKEINGYAHWVGRGESLSGRFLKKARTLALRNSHKLEEIANA